MFPACVGSSAIRARRTPTPTGCPRTRRYLCVGFVDSNILQRLVMKNRLHFRYRYARSWIYSSGWSSIALPPVPSVTNRTNRFKPSRFTWTGVQSIITGCVSRFRVDNKSCPGFRIPVPTICQTRRIMPRPPPPLPIKPIQHPTRWRSQSIPIPFQGFLRFIFGQMEAAHEEAMYVLYDEKYHGVECNSGIAETHRYRMVDLIAHIEDDDHIGEPRSMSHPLLAGVRVGHALCTGTSFHIRFSSISSVMKQLQTSTFLDYMQPYKDKERELFSLLAKIPIAWVPHSRGWELSNSSYSEENCEALSESIVSCPICVTITPLMLFYECTHECCRLCKTRNEQKLCSQCRRPERVSTWVKTSEELRLVQFNRVLSELLYRCPCEIGKCKPKKLCEVQRSKCPARFVCPLLGMDGCEFKGPRRAMHRHITRVHTMVLLWKAYRESAIVDGVKESNLSAWCNEGQLIQSLLGDGL
jgi:hypothetical protein